MTSRHLLLASIATFLPITSAIAANDLIWTASASHIWSSAASTNWVVSGSSTPVPFFDLDSVTFDDSTADADNIVSIAGAVSPGSVVVDAGENYSFSGDAITGATTLTKRGSGVLTLQNNNTYTGITTINAGILSVGDGGLTGTPGSGEIAINGTSQLVINRSGNDLRLLNRLSGTGTLKKLGTGRLILDPSQSYMYFTGKVEIAAGEVLAGGNHCFGTTSGVTISAGSAFDFANFKQGAVLTINGNGTSGDGVLKNNSGIANTEAKTGGIVLASDSSIGGNSFWGMVNSFQGYEYRPYVSGDFTLTKVGANTISFTETDLKVKNIVIQSGTFIADTATTISNTSPGTLTVDGGMLSFGGSFVVQTGQPTCAKPIVLNGGMLAANGGVNSRPSISGSIQLNAATNVIGAETGPLASKPDSLRPPAQLSISGTVSGSGSLVMTGFGVVTLTSAPAYSGDTIVLGGASDYFRGRLKLQASGLNDNSKVVIRDRAILELAFSGTDTVSKLFIGGVQQPAGTYDSSHPSGSIAGTGSLTVINGPGNSPYEVWANAHLVADAGPDEDSDHDGASNLVEYVTGGDPGVADAHSSGLLPAITHDGTNLVFTFRRTTTSTASHAAKVAYSTGLTGDWTIAQHGVDGVSIAEELNGFGAGIDKVTVSIPAIDNSKLFARLQVEAL